MEWQEVRCSEYRELPDSYGIYCWRYRPRLTIIDIEKIWSDVAREQDPLQKPAILYTLLEQRFLNPFRHPGYTVTLTGPLLPKYSGIAEQRLPFSKAMFTNAVADESSLKQFLEMVNLAFDMSTVPFYIGVARDQTLRSRISRHIQALTRAKQGAYLDQSEFDSNLAERIASRQIPLRDLYISFLSVPESCKDFLIDLEYILNRTHFPILGRN